MKNNYYWFVCLLFSLSGNFALAQRDLTGKVVDTNDSPLPGVNVNIKGSAIGTVTDAQGNFTLLEVKAIDTLIFAYVGYQSRVIVINDNTSNLIVKLDDDIVSLSEVVVGGMSSYNSWVGASLAYNLDGADADNIIAAAKVRINTVKRFSGDFRLSTIGNIAKPTAKIDTAEIRKDIRTVSQSGQGLSIGLEPLYKVFEKKDVVCRTWASFNYKLNIFQDVKVDAESEDINFSQFRFTLGAELEAFVFEDGGKRLHFGIEGAISTFDSDKYLLLFNEEKSNLLSLEWSVVVPLFGNMGLLVGQTLTKGIKPTLSAGVIIATMR